MPRDDTPLVESYAAEQSKADLPGAGLPWLAALRSGALARFRTLGFPTQRDEDWKYTSLRGLTRRPFSPVRANGAVPVPDAGLESIRMVFVDGHYRPELSDRSPPAGLILAPLSQALAAVPERVEPHLGRVVPPECHALTALNSAFVSEGALVMLEGGQAPERPVELVFVTSEPEGLSQPRNLVVAGPGARLRVVERYIGHGTGARFTNAVTEVVAGPDARIEHYKLQDEVPDGFHVGGLFVSQGADSHFVSHNVALGSALARTDCAARLGAPGARCSLNGLYVTGGRQHHDNHTSIEHAVPGCVSRELYKGILDGRGRAVFHGRVVVHPDAQASDAEQSNQNLLLSRDAEVDTKPQLEIYADDVKCAHGATVGQLDEAAVFYMRSRGVDEAEARRALTHAFAAEVLERMEIAPARERLEQELAVRLGGERQSRPSA